MSAAAGSEGPRCEYCDSPLPLIGEGRPDMLFTAFPKMFGNCAAHLAFGPSALLCKVCGKVTKLALVQLVIGPDGRGVLYLPDDRAAPDPAREAAISRMLSDLHSFTPESLITVRNERDFRRAFITAFISPAAKMLNDYVLDEGPPLDWVARHLDGLDARFFGAITLIGMGLLPVFLAPASSATEPYVQHEAAPPEASHVVRQREAQDEFARRGGNILGLLLVHWVTQILEARSFNSFLDAMKAMLPPGRLLEPTVEAATARIENLVEQFTLGEPGATLGRYVAEAVLALLLCSRDTPNPRCKDWSKILLRYEFERRLDGNSEELLLDTALLRPTLDMPLFWRAVRALQWALRKEEDQLKQMERYLLLAETVERLFPGQTNLLEEIKLSFADHVADEALLNFVHPLLNEVLRNLSETTLPLRWILMGIANQRENLLEAVIEAALAPSTPFQRPAASACRIARHGIEALHIAHRFGAALRLAETALMQLAEAETEGFTAHEKLRLLNEIANTRRYSADYRGALAIYDEILACLSSDLTDRDFRVVARNRAIVLRELHRYSEALAAFRSLRAAALDNELISLIVSEAICLRTMGEGLSASRLLRDHAHLIEGRSVGEVSEFVRLLAQVHLDEGRDQEAAHLADYLEKQKDTLAQLVAQRVRLRLAANSGKIDEVTAWAAVQDLLKAFELAQELHGIPSALLATAEDLDFVLRKAGELDAAEQFVRTLLETGISMATPQGWILHILALRHAARRRDLDTVFDDTIGGMKALCAALDSLSSEADLPALLAPHQDVLEELVAWALRLVEHDTPDVSLLARAAGDLRAAPVLTVRLLRRAGLEAGVLRPEAEATRIAELLFNKKCVAVQAIEAEGKVALLLTRATGSKGVVTEVRRLPITIHDAAVVGAGLPPRLRRVMADAERIHIANLDPWPSLASALCEALSELPTDQMLAISPGLVGSLAFSLALGGERPVCFVPSLGALTALRAERLARPGGLAWRPKSMLDFAVWFATERKEEASSLAKAPAHGAAIAAQYGLSHRALGGREGTAESLMAALEDTDVARIACHGRILAEQEAIDLIVAAEGRLPPSNLSKLLEAGRAPHILGWRRIAALRRAPSVVFSSACDSGATIHDPGGERLGLERAFFAAGSVAYVAPQWPVPTIAIQDLIDKVVVRWLADTSAPLAQVIYDERVAARNRGESPLGVEALAVFGDGL